MNATTTEAAVLKLTVAADGQLWMLDGDGLPRPSEMTGAEFLRNPGRLASEQVRVVGSAGNARLILRLYELRLRDEIGSVEVCSPLVCATAADRNDPERLLYAMRLWSVATSLGGWHELTRADFVAYAMADALARGDQPALLGFFRQHPVYRPLTFMPVDPFGAAILIAELIDPRWYIDTEAPDRPGKMFAFLGLDPGSQKGGRAPYRTRNRLVRDVWDVPAGAHKGPSTFIRRYFETQKFEGVQEWRAALRASQRFVRFLRAVWLDALYPVPAGAERLFEPKLYFKSGAEEMAFSAHMKKAP